MARTARTFRYVGAATPATNTAAGILDALYSLTQATTYADDGSARSPGSGVAVTGTQHQVGGTTECVDIAPVTSTHSTRYLFAGSASARTPTMITSPHTHTWATGTVLAGLARSWNTYNATGNGWDQTLPGGVGSIFTGWGRTFATGSLTIAKVHLFECADGIVVAWATSSGAVFCGMGDDIDPHVTNANSPLAAEATTDGRYLLWSTTSTAVVSTAFNSATGSNVPFSSSSANQGFCYVLSVGGVTLTAVEKAFALTNTTGTTSFVNADGDYIPLELWIVVAGSNTMVGRLREIRIARDAELGQTYSVGGTKMGVFVGSHPTAANDALVVMR